MANLDVNGASFYYELHGDKSNPGLVLISGYTGDHSFWQPILTELAEKFYVLTFDNRAVGQTTDDVTTPLSVELMAEDTMALVRALGIEQPIIMGQSMGGAIAQVIATKYADEVRQLCILNTPIKWNHVVVNDLRNFLKLKEVGADIDTLFDEIFRLVYSARFCSKPENKKSVIDTALANPYPQELAAQKRQFAALEKFTGATGLENINIPTLVLYGPEDIVCLEQEAKQVAKAIPGSELVELKNTAHNPLLEAKNELLEALDNFFSVTVEN